ncbi:MAG: hypothetical protein JWO92_14 [Chitinophagaceae bacterium]|nr:hypothetical protein [Chitinophagaceae bacterium]
MKSIIIFFLCILSNFVFAQNTEQLTNKSIIDLTKAGIGKATQKSMITSTSCSFLVDTKSILELKKNKVDDEVISSMIDKMNENKPSATNTLVENDNSIVQKLLKEGSGIYTQLIDSNIQELDPSVFSQSKQGSFLANALTYGFAKTKQKMSVSGKSANLQLSNRKPVFYFVFTAAEKNLNQQMPSWFDNATSPNEFVLVKFNSSKNNNREITTGSADSYSGSVQGIDDKQKQNFQSKKLAKGVYQITFENFLEPGEYCFMYAGAIVQNSGNPKVYDFGVK